MMVTQFHRKHLVLLVGNMTKMQNTGYDYQKSAGSRIGILANEVICNDDLRYKIWRLYGSCDLSKRRVSKFRKS